MIGTGTVTVPAALGEGEARRVWQWPSHVTSKAVVRRPDPRAPSGLMDTSAVVRRPFPVPCVGLMELPTYA